MKLNDIVKSKPFKHFMAKLYGIGAAVVILGALFKILHWTGANEMLMIGMGTETIIFFFSAFEPPHVDPDWSLVYPQLAGMYHNDDNFDALGGETTIIQQTNESEKDSVTQHLDEMLENAKIGPELIESLGKGLENLSKNASDFSSLSSSVAANTKFTQNLQSATDNVDEVAKAYGRTAGIIERENDSLTVHMNKFEAAANAASTLSNTYNTISETMQNEQVGSQKKIVANMGAMSEMYELQLKHAQHQLEASEKLHTAMTGFFDQVNETAAQTVKYKEQSEILTQKVSDLNKVYGNMLSAMTVR